MASCAPKLLLLCWVLVAATAGDNTSSTDGAGARSLSMPSSIGRPWQQLMAAAVEAAPVTSNIMLLSDHDDEFAASTATGEAAWSSWRGIVSSSCNSRATDVRRQIDEAGATSTSIDWIVMMMCPLQDVRRMFKEARDADQTVSWLRWLVLGTRGELTSALPSLIREGDQVTAVEEQTPELRYIIYNSVPDQGREMSLTETGSWRPADPVPSLAQFLYPSLVGQYSDMQGRLLRVAVVDNWPFFGITEREDGSWQPSSGIDHSVVDALAGALNFTYIIVSPSDQQWGGVQDDGSVTGMIGMVARREADFAIDEITVTDARESVVDFTHPYYVESSVIVTRAPAEAQMTLAIFLPFSNTVWGCLVFTLVAATAGVVAIIALTPQALQHSKAQRMKEYTRNPLMVLFVMYRSLVIQGNVLIVVQQAPLRIMLASWIFFCELIYAMYAGTLTAVLAAPSLEVPINSLTELLVAAQEGRVLPAMLAGSAVEALMTEANDGVYHELSKHFKPGVSDIQTPNDIVLRVLPGDLAYMDGGLAMELNTVRHGKHRFFLGRDRFYMQSYGVACISGSPIKLVLDEILSHLVCSGLIQRFKSREVQKAASKVRSTEQTVKGNRALTLTHLQGAFLVYLMGIGGSMAGLLGELLLRNHGKKQEINAH